jgi:integrase
MIQEQLTLFSYTVAPMASPTDSSLVVAASGERVRNADLPMVGLSTRRGEKHEEQKDKNCRLAKRRSSLKGCPPLQSIELLLRRASVGAQLLAALSYDTGIRVERLLDLRVFDIYFGKWSFRMGHREYTLSRSIAEDLRSYIHDKVCGYDASAEGDGVRQYVFNSDAGDELNRILAEVGITSRELRVSGRLHLYQARRRKGDPAWKKAHPSPLTLLEKGPMIVRRGRGGVIRAYYLWRGAVVL